MFSVGIQVGVVFIVALAINVSGVEAKDIELVLLQPDIMLLIVMMTVIISLPLIKRASLLSDYASLFRFLAIKPIKTVTLIKIIVLATLYYYLISILMQQLGIDVPQYMLDTKSQVHSTLDFILQTLAICIIAPIFEEVIFRGLAFSRFQYSKLGLNGAIFFTSITFTIAHFQYELIILVFIFIMALILAFIRYKTENLNYCIAFHILFNSLSTFELFFLL